MLATHRVGWLNGVVVATKAGTIRFDPSRKESCGNFCTFISHAHSDHIRGLNSGKGYLTAETRDILSNGNHKEEAENFVSLRYGDEVAFDGLGVTAYNAGHILGSAQYVIRDAESTIVYTGDLNCRETLTTTAGEAISCDTLILETTYGNPSYIFPSLTEIHVDVVNWAIGEIQKGKVPTFVVYSVGKAQEIVKIFNEFTSVPVITSHSVARVNEIYNRSGVKLNYLDFTSEEGKEFRNQPCIQVISPHERPQVVGHCSFAVATGWALKKSHVDSVDAAFPLSSHADFSQLINYVERAKPREVFTVHGFKEDFASYVSRRLGIRARAVPQVKQSSLGAFM